MKSKLIIVIVAVLSFSLLVSPAFAGSGSLWAYDDSSYSSAQLLAKDSNAGGSWVVWTGLQIYVQIAGITEFNVGQLIEVRVGYTDDASVSHSAYLGTFEVKTLTSGGGSGMVGVGDAANPIGWLVGTFADGYIDIPYCKTMVLQYRSASGGQTYIANGMLSGASHLHAVPEYLYGGLAALATCFVGFAAFKSRSSIRAKIHK